MNTVTDMVMVNLSRYEELLKVEERINIIKRFIETGTFLASSDLLLILGVVKEEKDNENS